MDGKLPGGGTAAEPRPPVSGERGLLDAARRNLLANYRPPPLFMQRGCGCELYDTEGRRYLDFCAGVAVMCLGHSHPEMVAALAEQSARLVHVSNYFYNEQNVLAAAELCAATGFDRAFFCNSGTEANEALLKLARRHYYEQGQPQRLRVLCFERAFHGRTLGALAMTGNERYRTGFGALMSGIEHLPFGDLDAVSAAMGPDVAAIVVEPVQGEGGVFVAPPGFLAGLRALCDQHGSLLMFDEVQVGIGRTGKLLAAEHWAVDADAVALAKGLGGGFPVGAMLLRERLAGGLPPGAHGSTFGGGALASAAVRTVLRVVARDGLCAAAERLGERLGAGLRALARAHPRLCVGERGLGLLRAVVLVEGVAARDLLGPARECGLLLTAAGPGALRFTPPLTVTEQQIDEALRLAGEALSNVEGHRA